MNELRKVEVEGKTFVVERMHISPGGITTFFAWEPRRDMFSHAMLRHLTVDGERSVWGNVASRVVPGGGDRLAPGLTGFPESVHKLRETNDEEAYDLIRLAFPELGGRDVKWSVGQATIMGGLEDDF